MGSRQACTGWGLALTHPQTPSQPLFYQPAVRLQLYGCLVDPFCQPLPYAHEALVADRADAADQQFAVDDARRDRRSRLGTFSPVLGKSASAGVRISSSPSSACWVCDETMQTSQSSKLVDACRNMSAGRSFVPEKSV